MQPTTRNATESLSYFYEENGYAVVPEVICGVELADLRRGLDEVLAEADESPASQLKFAYTDGRDPSGHRYVKRIFDPIARHEVFRELVRNERVLDIVESLIGPNITLQQTKLNLKPPSPGAEFGWHQDYPFFPHTNFDLVALMLFLDDVDETNGPLKVVRRSHRLGPVRHVFSEDGQAYGTVIEDESLASNEDDVVSLVGPAGTIGLHHCCTLHSSGPNRTKHGRSMFIAEYKATDNRQIGGAMDPVGWGVQLRGQDSRQVRMIAGTFELPGRVHLIGERVASGHL